MKWTKVPYFGCSNCLFVGVNESTKLMSGESEGCYSTCVV